MFRGIGDKDLLIKMIKSPNCVDGCKLVSMRFKNNKTQFRKGAWTFVCSHGLVMNDMVDSHFDPESVGKSHVPFQGYFTAIKVFSMPDVHLHLIQP
jgi:hypothetical protein